MSAFDVVIREGKTERLIVVTAGSKRECESKVRSFWKRDATQVEIVSMTKQPHSKTVKSLPRHIETYLSNVNAE